MNHIIPTVRLEVTMDSPPLLPPWPAELLDALSDVGRELARAHDPVIAEQTLVKIERVIAALGTPTA